MGADDDSVDENEKAMEKRNYFTRPDGLDTVLGAVLKFCLVTVIFLAILLVPALLMQFTG